MKKYSYVSAAVLALWAIVGGWFVPRLIRQAYRGESLPVLNEMLSGRSAHPVEFYLDAWRSLALTVTALLLALLAAVYLGFGFPKARKTVITWAVGGTPSLTPRTLMWYSAFWGTFGGLAEAGFRGGRQFFTLQPATGFYRELFWMAPLSSCLVALIVAGLLLALARTGGTAVGLWKATVLFGFVAIYGVAQSRGIPLLPLSEVILSLGLAAAVGRAAVAQAGRVTRFITVGRPYLVGAFGVLAILAALNLPSVAERRALSGRAAARSNLPNILLIILDTVRATNLSLYGYDRPTTPRIDDWAMSGTVFELALATSPWTLPTHASIFTGRYNFEMNTSSLRPLDLTFPTLAEILAGQGYATGGFVANLVFTTETSGLQRGFDRYEDHPITLGGLVASSWLSRTVFRPIKPWTGESLRWGSKNAEQVRDEFLGWMDRKPDRPFFAFLNFFDAHDPYPLNPYSAAYGPPSIEPWSDFDARWQSHPDSLYSPEQAQSWVNQYDGALTYIDHQIGVILDTLKARGILENTLVIITSDHGESFGEHGLIGHRNSLYMPQLHVPLAISFPGRVPSNVRVREGVTLRDLPATILDLVDLWKESPIPGNSLASLWVPGAPKATNSPRLAEVALEAGNTEPWAPVSNGDMKTLFDGGLHYILNGDGFEELYDIDRDREELRNLVTLPEFTPALDRLRWRLDSIM